jgi:hypothetical protein
MRKHRDGARRSPPSQEAGVSRKAHPPTGRPSFGALSNRWAADAADGGIEMPAGNVADCGECQPKGAEELGPKTSGHIHEFLQADECRPITPLTPVKQLADDDADIWRDQALENLLSSATLSRRNKRSMESGHHQ